MPPALQRIQVHARLPEPGVRPAGVFSLKDGDGNLCTNLVDASFPSRGNQWQVLLPRPASIGSAFPGLTVALPLAR